MAWNACPFESEAHKVVETELAALEERAAREKAEEAEAEQRRQQEAKSAKVPPHEVCRQRDAKLRALRFSRSRALPRLLKSRRPIRRWCAFEDVADLTVRRASCCTLTALKAVRRFVASRQLMGTDETAFKELQHAYERLVVGAT